MTKTTRSKWDTYTHVKRKYPIFSGHDVMMTSSRPASFSTGNGCHYSHLFSCPHSKANNQRIIAVKGTSGELKGPLLAGSACRGILRQGALYLDDVIASWVPCWGCKQEQNLQMRVLTAFGVKEDRRRICGSQGCGETSVTGYDR